MSWFDDQSRNPLSGYRVAIRRYLHLLYALGQQEELAAQELRSWQQQKSEEQGKFLQSMALEAAPLLQIIHEIQPEIRLSAAYPTLTKLLEMRELEALWEQYKTDWGI